MKELTREMLWADGVEKKNLVVLQKPDGSQWLFFYADEDYAALMQTLGRFAGDPEMPFDWTDAAVLSQRARQLKNERPNGT